MKGSDSHFGGENTRKQTACWVWVSPGSVLQRHVCKGRWNENCPRVREIGVWDRREQEMQSILVRRSDSARETQTSWGKG